MGTKVIESSVSSTDKKRSIIKNKEGYYRVTFGKLNTYTDSGIYYRVTDVDEALGAKSLVGKRIDKGLLRGEYTHPDVEGLTETELKRRTVWLELDNVAAHIQKIEIIDTGKTEPGFKNNILEIYGWVKPEGSKGEHLKEMLENPVANVAFSIRSLVYQHTVGSITIREVVIISTWDLVHEPGVGSATQWNSVGVESMDTNITKEELADLRSGFENSDLCKDGVCIVESLDTAIKNNNPLLNW